MGRQLGTALAIAEDDLPTSAARVETDVETPADQWAPISVGSDMPHPSAVLFVDGVRRIDRRVWIDDSQATGNGPKPASSCGPGGDRIDGGVRVLRSRRRLLLRISRAAAGTFLPPRSAGACSPPPRMPPTSRPGPRSRAQHTVGSDTVPLTMTLSNALQQALGEIEVITALAARAGLPRAAEHAGSPPCGQDGADDDLLVIDGPLRNRAHLPRTMGLIKTHLLASTATRAEPRRRRAYRGATTLRS